MNQDMALGQFNTRGQVIGLIGGAVHGTVGRQVTINCTLLPIFYVSQGDEEKFCQFAKTEELIWWWRIMPLFQERVNYFGIGEKKISHSHNSLVR